MRKFVALALSASLTSCAVIVKRVDVETVPIGTPRTVKGPTKAHLADGWVAVFPNGVTVTSDGLEGTGMLHDLTRTMAVPVQRLAIADVKGTNQLFSRVDWDRSRSLSLRASLFLLMAFAALLVPGHPDFPIGF